MGLFIILLVFFREANIVKTWYSNDTRDEFSWQERIETKKKDADDKYFLNKSIIEKLFLKNIFTNREMFSKLYCIVLYTINKSTVLSILFIKL